jgi:hypothetical protein
MVNSANRRTFRLIRAILIAQVLCLLSSICVALAVRTAHGFFRRGLDANETAPLAIYAVPLVDDRCPIE